MTESTYRITFKSVLGEILQFQVHTRNGEDLYPIIQRLPVLKQYGLSGIELLHTTTYKDQSPPPPPPLKQVRYHDQKPNLSIYIKGIDVTKDCLWDGKGSYCIASDLLDRCDLSMIENYNIPIEIQSQ